MLIQFDIKTKSSKEYCDVIDMIEKLFEAHDIEYKKYEVKIKQKPQRKKKKTLTEVIQPEEIANYVEKTLRDDCCY